MLVHPLVFPRYHEWMKSPELQQLTASEPLSLQQEYDMQKSWREDDDSTVPQTQTITMNQSTFNKWSTFVLIFKLQLSRMHIYYLGQAALGGPRCR